MIFASYIKRFFLSLTKYGILNTKTMPFIARYDGIIALYFTVKENERHFFRNEVGEPRLLTLLTEKPLLLMIVAKLCTSDRAIC